MANLRDEYTDELMKAVLKLKSEEECYRFFEDLCSVAEIKEMSRRLLAAKLLKKGIVYTEIGEQTGLSTATISRVSRCLKYGDGGYNCVLERLETDTDNTDNKEEKQ